MHVAMPEMAPLLLPTHGWHFCCCYIGVLLLLPSLAALDPAVRARTLAMYGMTWSLNPLLSVRKKGGNAHVGYYLHTQVATKFLNM